ncbi:daunorubicin C-13 ketoreductase [Plectosphaerella plurivora]|uniref:Daunorubicin C-13 ketoreductase n=1 Tax=Plectosphaerella plurivora TaxID=936078 RepID=A0A9P8V4W3_9PEZI|nr:daunorubicin C-13 ketoreductase [Plectosphaerella plurivora]
MISWTPKSDMPDLHGKVALVTGASTGIGFQIVQQLRRRGAKVFATTRTEKSADAAREKLRVVDPDLGPGNVEWLLLDLASLKSINDTATTIKQSSQRLDILINNAATITAEKELVAGRWEKNMAVNAIGPFLLTNLLMPLLESTIKLSGADVRIVTVASIAPATFLPTNFHYNFESASGLVSPVSSYPPSWRFGIKFLFASDMILYSVSKAAVQAYASELQRLLDARGLPILSLIVHPGAVATEGVADANGPFLRTMANLTFISSEQGAATPLFAATAAVVQRDPESYKHKLLMPNEKIEPLVSVANDEVQSQQLWDLMTEELGRYLAAEGLPPMEKW